jgi:hypothetical protein
MKKSLFLMLVTLVAVAMFAFGCKKQENVNVDTAATDTGVSSTMSTTDTSAISTTGTSSTANISDTGGTMGTMGTMGTTGTETTGTAKKSGGKKKGSSKGTTKY